MHTVAFAGFRFFHSLSHTALASFAAFRTQPFTHGRFRQQSHFAVFWHTAACSSFCRTRSLLPAFASSAVFHTRSPSATFAFSQSSSTRLLVAVFVAHGRFWQHTLFAVPPHTVAFDSVHSSRTRLLLRFPLQLLPFCSPFQHLLSPSSHSRSPFGSSPCTRPPVASLHPLAAFSNRVPHGSDRSVASRTRPLLAAFHLPFTISSHTSYHTWLLVAASTSS